MMTTGRAGSSMFAGIFHKHGCFVGKTNPPSAFNRKGFFENLTLKNRMKNKFGFDLLGPLPEYDPEFKKQALTILHEQGYRGGPWLMKTGAFYWKVWSGFKPKYVKIRRNLDDILKSYKKVPYLNNYTDKQVEQIMIRQMAEMDSIPGPYLDYELAIKGDYSQLEAALSYCGLKFVRSIAEDFIDPELKSV